MADDGDAHSGAVAESGQPTAGDNHVQAETPGLFDADGIDAVEKPLVVLHEIKAASAAGGQRGEALGGVPGGGDGDIGARNEEGGEKRAPEDGYAGIEPEPRIGTGTGAAGVEPLADYPPAVSEDGGGAGLGRQRAGADGVDEADAVAPGGEAVGEFIRDAVAADRMATLHGKKEIDAEHDGLPGPRCQRRARRPRCDARGSRRGLRPRCGPGGS